MRRQQRAVRAFVGRSVATSVVVVIAIASVPMARARANESPSKKMDVEDAVSQIDGIVAKTMKYFGTPGVAVAVVRDAGMLTIAASFDSGWDFVRLLGLEGGMPTRVSVPEARLDEVLTAINQAPLPEAAGDPERGRR